MRVRRRREGQLRGWQIGDQMLRTRQDAGDRTQEAERRTQVAKFEVNKVQERGVLGGLEGGGWLDSGAVVY